MDLDDTPRAGHSSTTAIAGFAAGARRAGPTPRLPALPHDDVDAACRARVKALGEAGFLKAVVPAEHGGLHPRLDVRTLCLAREILALPRRARGFRLRHAGPGHRLDLAVRHGGLQARYLPPVRDGRAHRRLRAVGAGGRLRRRGAGDDRDAGRRRPCPPRRREDLDLQRRHRRPLRRLRPHRRRRRAPRGLSAFVVDADTPGLDGRRAHRGDRAASAGDAARSTACACR